MDEWHFLRPEALGLLGVVALCVVVRLTVKKKDRYINNISKEVLPYLWIGGKHTSVWGWLNLLPVAAFSAGVIALAGPVKERISVQNCLPDVALSIVLDLSDDLSEQDVNASRMWIYNLLDNLQNEKVSLVLQAGSAHILLPFTSDYRLVKSYLKWVSPDIMPVPGRNLSLLEEKIEPYEEGDYHAVIYVTDQADDSLYSEWTDLHLKADYARIVATCKGDAAGESFRILPTDIRKNAKIKKDRLDAGDTSVWKDEGYKLCWWVTALFFPLFLRFRNKMPLILWTVLFTSCSYTSERINEAMTGIYLWKGDTLKAIDVSENSLERGILYLKLGMYEEALLEFSEDSALASRYNAAFAMCHTGNYIGGLHLFRTLSVKYPDCVLIKENIKRLEEFLYKEQSVPEKHTDNDDIGEMDSYEKDKYNKEPEGNEEVIWADKLINDSQDQFVYGKESSSRHGEILFRQIENNPKEFIKRKLRYEYLQKK